MPTTLFDTNSIDLLLLGRYVQKYMDGYTEKNAYPASLSYTVDYSKTAPI